jgi:hypothetical protein
MHPDWKVLFGLWGYGLFLYDDDAFVSVRYADGGSLVSVWVGGSDEDALFLLELSGPEVREWAASQTGL